MQNGLGRNDVIRIATPRQVGHERGLQTMGGYVRRHLQQLQRILMRVYHEVLKRLRAHFKCVISEQLLCLCHDRMTPRLSKNMQRPLANHSGRMLQQAG